MVSEKIEKAKVAVEKAPVVETKSELTSHRDKLVYKGYVGKVVYDGDSNLLFGEVINSLAIITFRGCDVEELRESFMSSVDIYLDYCEETGEEPERPPAKDYSGRFLVRVEPDLHRKATECANLLDMSLNSFVIDAIEKQLVYA